MRPALGARIAQADEKLVGSQGRGGIIGRRLSLIPLLDLLIPGLLPGPPAPLPHLERWLGSTLEAESVTAWMWWTLQWPILLGGLLFAFATVLYLGPDVEQRTWKLVSPGALTAVLIWLVASGGFALYAASFGTYNKSWGALSAVVVTLVWLWLTSASLLFGAEINAEAERIRGKTESHAAVL